MSAAALQLRFARALLDPAIPTPAEFVAWNGSDPGRRVAVHRNNVIVSLIDALGAKFPVVAQLVGADFFAAMARAYVLAEPPRSPILALYGDTFAAFIARFAPAGGLPYLADVARLEAIQMRAYHAADAPALGAQDFACIAPEALADLVLRLHPSVGVIASDYAIVSLWAAHNGLADIADVDPFAPESALVVRPRLEVETTRLAPGGVAFFEAFANGLPLSAAAAAAEANHAGFDLPAALHSLMATGAATSIHCQKEERP
jgi:hypothetical protein